MAHIDECTLQCVYAVERETKYELLKQKIHQYEIENFNEISQREEFLNFDVEKLQYLLELDNLKITCEEDAYNAITRWCNHNVSARREHLPRLIACLRLTQFDVDFLLSHIQSLPGCELLALQSSMWIRDHAARAKINIRFTEARVACIGAGNCSETTMLAVYYNDNLGSLCIMQYNKAEDKWEEYASIEYRTKYSFRTILKEDNILFIGGCGENYDSFNTVISWSIRNKTWRELPAMNQARDSHCVVEFDGKIYAIGGQNDGNTLQSVERYTTSNGWEFVKPLITARYGVCAVTLNGKIYVYKLYYFLNNKFFSEKESFTFRGICKHKLKRQKKIYLTFAKSYSRRQAQLYMDTVPNGSRCII
ncbi:kelch-like protein 17 [Zeugodacus cucurbitae]|uniref:kelch-like protein 17 n=1 Tax=Zeugodacus cucurbitae TaxID=28588 RepID=UPI0023D944D2|nr:kelch-like protein 17 [Zeugodacus cucurbitae]